MSAFLGEGEKSEIRKLGCAYFEKPLDLDDLAAWLKQCESRLPLSQPLACRRSTERVSDDRRVYCTIGHDETVFSASTVNVSATGLCLELPSRPEAGQLVRFNADASLAATAASVRWVKEQGNGSYLAGLRYC